MSLDVHWHVPGRIIYSYDVLSVEDRIERNRKILELIQTEGQPPAVHLLIDFSSTAHGNYPASMREMLTLHETHAELKAMRERLVRHPLLGWVVSIGAQNEMLTAGATVMASKLQYRRRAVDTLSDAIAFLKRVDGSLAGVV